MPPYIQQEDRIKFEHLIKGMHVTKISGPGELNYLITQLVHSYLSQRSESYQAYNDIMGAITGAQLELYRRFVVNYEDEKIDLNGDVP